MSGCVVHCLHAFCKSALISRYQEEDKELEEMIAASGVYFTKTYFMNFTCGY